MKTAELSSSLTLHSHYTCSLTLLVIIILEQLPFPPNHQPLLFLLLHPRLFIIIIMDPETNETDRVHVSRKLTTQGRLQNSLNQSPSCQPPTSLTPWSFQGIRLENSSQFHYLLSLFHTHKMMPIWRKSHSRNKWGHYKYTVSNFTWISALLGNPSIIPYQFPLLFLNPLPHFISNLCKHVQKEIEVTGGMRSFFNFLFPLPLEELSTCIPTISSNRKGEVQYLHPFSHLCSAGPFRWPPNPAYLLPKVAGSNPQLSPSLPTILNQQSSQRLQRCSPLSLPLDKRVPLDTLCLQTSSSDQPSLHSRTQSSLLLCEAEDSSVYTG